MSHHISESINDYCIKRHTQNDGRTMRSRRRYLFKVGERTINEKCFLFYLVKQSQSVGVSGGKITVAPVNKLGKD